MIKLSENRIALSNLDVTFRAMDKLKELIRVYSEDKPGPAYCAFNYVLDEPRVQIDRAFIVPALKAQYNELCCYLNSLGIEVDE